MKKKDTKSFSTFKKSALMAIFIVVALITCLACKYSVCSQSTKSIQPKTINTCSTKKLINALSKHALWNKTCEQNPSIITIITIKRFPKNIKNAQLKEKNFIHTLIPAATVAMLEIKEERTTLKDILKKLDNPKIIDVNKNNLTEKEKEFVKFIVKKYRINNSSELLKRVDEVPLSLILAQGAIESNWGTSRFAIEGNNLFGIWTYKHKGIVPENIDPEDNHRVAEYPSILDSVRDYLYNLNVGWAYKEFREARTETKDAVKLANYLSKYSQRGQLYIKEVKNLSKRLNKQYATDKTAHIGICSSI